MFNKTRKRRHAETNRRGKIKTDTRLTGIRGACGFIIIIAVVVVVAVAVEV